MTPEQARIAYEERKQINDRAWAMREHCFEMRRGHPCDSDEWKRLSALAASAEDDYGYDLRDYNEKEHVHYLLSRDPAIVERFIACLTEANALIPNHDLHMLIDAYTRSEDRRSVLLTVPPWPPIENAPTKEMP